MTTVFTFDVDTIEDMFEDVVNHVVVMNDETGHIDGLMPSLNLVANNVQTIHIDVIEEDIDPSDVEELVDALEWRLADMMSAISNDLDRVDPAREFAYVNLAPKSLAEKFKWCADNSYSYQEGVSLYGSQGNQELGDYLDRVISAYVLSQIEGDLASIKDTLGYGCEQDVEDMARALAEQKFNNEGDK